MTCRRADLSVPVRATASESSVFWKLDFKDEACFEQTQVSGCAGVLLTG